MTSTGETEKAVLQQKFSNLEQEREKLIQNYEAEIRLEAELIARACCGMVQSMW